MKTTGKDKSTINLCIDIILLLLMMSIAGLGFLMKYVLLSGDQRNLVYGQKVDLSFWGLTRHQWGDIHLILSVIFLLLLLIHIILHWKMITCIFQRMIPYKPIRTACIFLLTGIGLLFFLFPLLVNPDIMQRDPIHQNQEKRNNYTPSINTLNTYNPKHPKSNVKHKKTLTEEYEIQGNMTLQYVAEKYSIPADMLASKLKIPENVVGEELRKLRKQYNFTMNDVRAIISKNKGEK